MLKMVNFMLCLFTTINARKEASYLLGGSCGKCPSGVKPSTYLPFTVANSPLTQQKTKSKEKKKKNTIKHHRTFLST